MIGRVLCVLENGLRRDSMLRLVGEVEGLLGGLGFGVFFLLR